jgi:ABC-type glycerol-3-phosphate transport system substrate-binding protein
MFKKWGTVIVVFLLVISIIAACSSGDNKGGSANDATEQPSSGQSAGNTGNDDAAGENGRSTVDIYLGTEVRKSSDKVPSIVHEEIGKKFGINFDPVYTWVNADTETKLSVLFASGDYPEVLLHVNHPEFVKNLGRQGYLLPWNDYLDRIPNYTAMWTDEEWDLLMKHAANEDGNLYYLPIRNYRTHSNAWIYRQDVFEKLNLEFPKTLDELYDVLKRLKQEYPDSVPMTNRSGASGLLWGIKQAYRISQDIFADPDLNDEIIYGAMSDKYRKVLIYANKLYKEDLVEKEFATITYDQWLERHYADKTYIEFSYGSRAADFNQESKDIPGVKWNWADIMIGAEGKPGLAVRELPFYSYGPVLTDKLSEEGLERLLEFVNWSVTDEGARLFEWGVEGVTYVMENGAPKFVDSIENDPNKRDKLLEMGIEYFLRRDLDMVKSSPQTNIDLGVSEAMANVPNAKQLTFNWTEELAAERLKLATTITDLTDQYTVKFIMNQLDPNDDDDWNLFIRDLQKANVERYVEIHKQALMK